MAGNVRACSANNSDWCWPGSGDDPRCSPTGSDVCAAHRAALLRSAADSPSAGNCEWRLQQPPGGESQGLVSQRVRCLAMAVTELPLGTCARRWSLTASCQSKARTASRIRSASSAGRDAKGEWLLAISRRRGPMRVAAAQEKSPDAARSSPGDDRNGRNRRPRIDGVRIRDDPVSHAGRPPPRPGDDLVGAILVQVPAKRVLGSEAATSGVVKFERFERDVVASRLVPRPGSGPRAGGAGGAGGIDTPGTAIGTVIGPTVRPQPPRSAGLSATRVRCGCSRRRPRSARASGAR
jgi:hypothetical protein